MLCHSDFECYKLSKLSFLLLYLAIVCKYITIDLTLYMTLGSINDY